MKKIFYILIILFILFQLKLIFDFYSPCVSYGNNSGSHILLPDPNCGRGWSLQKYLFDANNNLVLLPIQNFFNQIIISIGDIMLKFQR